MAKGADSAFAPYIENLPGKSDCLLHWGEEDLALLTGGPSLHVMYNTWMLVRRRQQLPAIDSICLILLSSSLVYGPCP
jgi:hypothetical protein